MLHEPIEGNFGISTIFARLFEKFNNKSTSKLVLTISRGRYPYETVFKIFTMCHIYQ